MWLGISPTLLIFHLTLQSFKYLLKVHLKYLSPHRALANDAPMMLAAMDIKPCLVFFS